jgi:hypothetical protein
MNVTAPLFEPITPGEARTWTPPQGRADIAPSRYGRIEGDGYLTIDAHWVVPALLRSVPIQGRVLEPAAGRGHLDPVQRDCRVVWPLAYVGEKGPLTFARSRRLPLAALHGSGSLFLRSRFGMASPG